MNLPQWLNLKFSSMQHLCSRIRTDLTLYGVELSKKQFCLWHRQGSRDYFSGVLRREHKGEAITLSRTKLRSLLCKKRKVSVQSRPVFSHIYCQQSKQKYLKAIDTFCSMPDWASKCHNVDLNGILVLWILALC